MSFDPEGDPRQAVFEKSQLIYRDPKLGGRSKEVSVALISLITRGYNRWAAGEKVKYLPIERNGSLIEPVRPIKRK